MTDICKFQNLHLERDVSEFKTAARRFRFKIEAAHLALHSWTNYFVGSLYVPKWRDFRGCGHRQTGWKQDNVNNLFGDVLFCDHWHIGRVPNGLTRTLVAILKREFQEEAMRMGLIPYIAERPLPADEDDQEQGDSNAEQV